MEGAHMLERQIRVAKGLEDADLVLKHGKIVNVFTEDIQEGDVAVCEGMIVGIGSYRGRKEVDCTGKYIAPGFMDGHIHLESSMMQPAEFARTVLPHGTTAVFTDPHEIANVCGTQGIDYMMRATEGLPLEVYFVLPSCVPAALLDESGACLEAEELKPYYQSKRVVGLAEVMNYVGTVAGDMNVLKKIQEAVSQGKVVDGHAPGLGGKELCAYLTAGVMSDHECATAEEGLERIRQGQWMMIREGTAAKNLEALMPLFERPYCEHAMLVTDDKHPGDLEKLGHIDYIIRKAVSLGADPCIAVKMATYNTARYFGLKHLGAVAPSYQADLVVLSDLKQVQVEQVYKKGLLVADRHNGCAVQEPVVNSKLKESVTHTFRMKRFTVEDFYLPVSRDRQPEKMRVIELHPGQILTGEYITEYSSASNGIDVQQDIIKLAVMERHLCTGHIGLGYVKNYGLKKGAIASSVAHDSHNLIVAGASEQDMYTAAEAVRRMQGGWAIALDGKVLEVLPLPIAGIMSDRPLREVEGQILKMKQIARELGVPEGIDPFMTLAFISLPVIPRLKLTTFGLVDTDSQEIVDAVF